MFSWVTRLIDNTVPLTILINPLHKSKEN